MLRLLNIELLKYKPYATFWVLLGLHFGLLFLSLLIVSNINFDVPGIDFSKIWMFPYVWNTVSWISSWFNILLTILIIVLVGNDFLYKTFRKNNIDGLSRNELLLSKIYTILVLSVYCFIINFILSLFMGFLFTGFSGITEVFENSFFLLIYFIQTIAYMTLGMFIAILVRNNALSILFFLLYLFPVELIIRSILPNQIAAFFPIKLISNLTPAPDFFNLIGNSGFTTTVNGQAINQAPINDFELESLTIKTFLVIIYILIFSFLSLYFVKKRDL